MAPAPVTRSAVDAHANLHRVSTDAAYDAALAALRSHGERVTDARRAVIEALARTHEHVSADRMVELLESSRPVVHRATVYRTLDILAELGIVTHVHTTGGAAVYHLAAAPAGNEHLHAHCRGCAAVIVIPIDALRAASVSIAERTGFRVESQQSTLVGLCASCARSA